ncbi:hypothetical protein cyc_03359 [Cyclospora cayetanensis]|uniref:Uncharacterized protein n=1 Tax=Cyclospora cayetanensis TaxID=88456 RepID=A0A1D3CUX9_9EIME|nr:hypothetical protein cyc_03359 [Cyclospora cayetanensis]
MSKSSPLRVGLVPGQIYTAQTLRGTRDPLAAQIEEPPANDLVLPFSTGRLGVHGGSLSDSHGSCSGDSFKANQQTLHSTVESIWGSASDAGSLQRWRKERGLRERRVKFGEIEGEPLSAQYWAGVSEKCRFQLYRQPQAVEPLRPPNAPVPCREKSSRASESSTLVLNTKTRQLERKGAKEVELIKRRYDTLLQQKVGGRTEKETENLCLLWEAFNRGCSDDSGWLRTKDFSWVLQRDERLFEIFGIKRKREKGSEEKPQWQKWLGKVFRNRDELLEVTRAGEQKLRAMLNSVRLVESHLIANERATDDLKMTFETFVSVFAKYLGDADPSEWASKETSFVEICTDKDPPYAMSITEMLVRDAILGISLTKTEARRPHKLQFGSVPLLEPPGLSLEQRASDRGQLQRAAEAKFMAQRIKNGDDHKLAARVRAEAEKTELELLQRTAKRESFERGLLQEDKLLLQRLREIREGQGVWHLRPLPKFKKEEEASAAAGGSNQPAGKAAAGKRTNGRANGAALRQVQRQRSTSQQHQAAEEQAGISRKSSAGSPAKQSVAALRESQNRSLGLSKSRSSNHSSLRPGQSGHRAKEVTS